MKLKSAIVAAGLLPQAVAFGSSYETQTDGAAATVDLADVCAKKKSADTATPQFSAYRRVADSNVIGGNGKVQVDGVEVGDDHDWDNSVFFSAELPSSAKILSTHNWLVGIAAKDPSAVVSHHDFVVAIMNMNYLRTTAQLLFNVFDENGDDEIAGVELTLEHADAVRLAKEAHAEMVLHRSDKTNKADDGSTSNKNEDDPTRRQDFVSTLGDAYNDKLRGVDILKIDLFTQDMNGNQGFRENVLALPDSDAKKLKSIRSQRVFKSSSSATEIATSEDYKNAVSSTLKVQGTYGPYTGSLSTGYQTESHYYESNEWTSFVTRATQSTFLVNHASHSTLANNGAEADFLTAATELFADTASATRCQAVTSAKDQSAMSKELKFFERFGTDYIKEVLFGGVWSSTLYFESSAVDKMKSMGIDVSVEAAYSTKFLFIEGNSASTESASSLSESAQETFASKKTQRTKTVLGGSAAEVSPEDWARTVPSAGQPIWLELESLSELIEDTATSAHLEVCRLAYLNWNKGTAEWQNGVNEETRVGWPNGNDFCLPKNYQDGCPGGTQMQEGFGFGSRRMDSEDDDANCYVARGEASDFGGLSFANNPVFQFCCKKLDNTNPAVTDEWPRGSYCVHHYHGPNADGMCPNGFQTSGSFHFDDEDDDNGNRHDGDLPTGSYGRDTDFTYCCKQDADWPINAPSKFPMTGNFMLLPFGDVCQSVDGYTYTMGGYRIDSEDDDNANSWSGAALPYGYWKRDVVVYYCRYTMESSFAGLLV
jgi:hypothetical protein